MALVVLARLSPRGSEVPRATWPLTRNEQAMYFRLQGALPDIIVLSQVSFGAVLSARSMAVRNTFNGRRADFVICEKSFKVVAIVELDDSSHDGNEARDEKRDAQLKNAGYRVLRYRGIPNIDRVQADFAPRRPPSWNKTGGGGAIPRSSPWGVRDRRGNHDSRRDRISRRGDGQVMDT